MSNPCPYGPDIYSFHGPSGILYLTKNGGDMDPADVWLALRELYDPTGCDVSDKVSALMARLRRPKP